MHAWIQKDPSGWGWFPVYVLVIKVFARGLKNSIAPRVGFVPVFLWKPIATGVQTLASPLHRDPRSGANNIENSHAFIKWARHFT